MSGIIRSSGNSKLGFSLIEMTIVLVVIGIMVSISLSFGSGQVQLLNVKTTQNKLERIDQALALYLKTNNALPCPADGSLVITSANFGVGNKSNTVAEPPTRYNNTACSNANFSAPAATPVMYAGVIPVRDIGLSDDYMFDGWGNRITYAVSKYCVDPDNWIGSNTYRCSASTGTTATTTTDGGIITVEDLSTTAVIRALNSSGTYLPGAAYIVMSHGKNGAGAYNHAGSATRLSATISSLEEENSHLSTTYDATYRDGLINDGTPGSAKYFDDIIHWKTAPRVWDDAYLGGIMPSCTSGNGLTSNGGASWSCADNSIPSWPAPASANSDDLVNWNYSKAVTGSSTPTPVVIDTTGKKYISVYGQCTAVSTSAASSSSSINIIFKNSGGTVLSDHVVCQAYLISVALTVGTSRTSSSIFLPIPSTAASTTIQPIWANDTAGSYIRAKWYLY